MLFLDWTLGAVYVNGPLAPSANVLAHNRFIQCKYTANPGQEYRFDIVKELTKMGLWRHEKNISHAYLLAICAQWTSIASNPAKISSALDPFTSERRFRQAYPSRIMLQPREGYFPDYVEFRVKDEFKLVLKLDKKVCYDAENKFTNNVEAVFYTNANCFTFKLNGDEHKVESTDVDMEGNINSNDHSFGPKKHKELLGAKVGVRFSTLR